MKLALSPSQKNRPKWEFLLREKTYPFNPIHLASAQKKYSENGLQALLVCPPDLPSKAMQSLLAITVSISYRMETKPNMGRNAP